MEELANAINDTRLSVSKALNGMQESGLLELHRGEIVIPDLEKMIIKAFFYKYQHINYANHTDIFFDSLKKSVLYHSRNSYSKAFFSYRPAFPLP